MAVATDGEQEDAVASVAGRAWKTKMLLRSVLSLSVAGWIGFAAAAPAAAAGVERKDYQVLMDVSREVRRYVNYTVFDDIQARVDNGAVMLLGKVTMPYKRNDIEQIVSRIPGVVTVANHIDVLPVSPFDDELRYRIARAIYGNPTFWQYASMVNPPIHIVVEGGHVTLTGVVQSNVDRMLARSLATSFGAFTVKNELRTDAEMEADRERIES
jgi:osmotically-inducible protein OsmY